ncbi:unnamed protein product [Rotaria magnacalcarata]|uniref:Uncharacterized protein n=1 Tax=Rotaria magnacalcarata TaxID=392030 RepID=A0A8S3CVG9_9BILA|nr:unnamed protein product [Rotaria magnacalcarata]
MAKYVMYLLDALQFTVIMLMQVTNGQESARRRAFEICFLQAITENDEKQIKRLRLIFDTHRGVQSPDPTLQALTTDPEKREKYLVTQCEYVLEHFENILRTLEKYQDRLYN